MDTSLLFRKRRPLTDEGLGWLSGDERGPWCARRNATGEAGVSAILIRALQTAAMHHAIVEAVFSAKDGRPITIVSSTSKSTGMPIESFLVSPGASTPWAAYLPNGGPEKVTYYLGLLVLAEAMAAPAAAVDLLDAYEALITATKGGTITADHKELLCGTADELYYYLRYQDLPIEPANDRLKDLLVHDLAAVGALGTLRTGTGVTPFSPQVFYDAGALHAYRAGTSSAVSPGVKPASKAKPRARSAASGGLPNSLGRFVGRQAQLLYDSLRRGKTVLLAGPTGTGKTLAVEDVAQQLPDARLCRLEGKEGVRHEVA